MVEDLWIDKVTLKKRVAIDESGLIELVSQRILTPHIKHTDGQYSPMPFSQNIPFYALEPHPSLWMGDQLIKVKHFYQVETTKEQIAEYLKTYLWFRQIDIDDAEYEGKINLPEKPKEEMTKLLQANTKEDHSGNISVYIQKRRREGVSDREIAAELKERKYTLAQIGRGLGFNRDLQDNQHDALKQRVSRFIAKSKKKK